MKNVAIPIGALVAVLLNRNGYCARDKGLLIASKQSSHPGPSETYVGLRNRSCAAHAKKLNLSATSRPTGTLGCRDGPSIVSRWHGYRHLPLRWKIPASTSTAVGVIFGGVGKPAINEAAQNFVRNCCGISQPAMKATTEFPLPGRGQG